MDGQCRDGSLLIINDVVSRSGIMSATLPDEGHADLNKAEIHGRIEGPV